MDRPIPQPVLCADGKTPYVSCGSHRNPIEFAQAIRNCEAGLAYLKKRGETFDTILVQGFSGALPGSILCHALGKRLVIVRKKEDSCHAPRIDGDWQTLSNRFIILDDFIDGGRTMARLLRFTDPANPPRAAVLYCREKPTYHYDVTFYRGKGDSESWRARFKPLGHFLFGYEEKRIL